MSSTMRNLGNTIKEARKGLQEEVEYTSNESDALNLCEGEESDGF